MTVYGADFSSHNTVNWAALKTVGLSFVTHKMSEGVGWRDPNAGAAAAGMQSGYAAVGFYHVLWPTNTQDNPENQADYYWDQVEALAPWWKDHPCFVVQSDDELFSNFTPYRAPTKSEIQRFHARVKQRVGGRGHVAHVAYAPRWLYGDSLAGLGYPFWASSYVGGSGGYKALYTQVPGGGGWMPYSGGPTIILQYSSTATFGTAARGDANAARVDNAAQLQQLLLGDDDQMTQADIDAINAHTDTTVAAARDTILAAITSARDNINSIVRGQGQQGRDATDAASQAELDALAAVDTKVDELAAAVAALTPGGGAPVPGVITGTATWTPG